MQLPHRWVEARRKTPSAGVWMPGLWADLECRKEELPAHFWQATARQRNFFQTMGFVEYGFGRFKPGTSLNPVVRETCRIIYLDNSYSQIAGLLCHKLRIPAKIGKDTTVRMRRGTVATIQGPRFSEAEITQVIVWLTSVFEKSTFSCTNNRNSFNPLPGDKVVWVFSDDTAAIYAGFRNNLPRWRGSPRVFSDQSSLRAWFDASQIKAFEARVRRRLFVKMTDEEIEEARGRMPPENPKRLGAG